MLSEKLKSVLRPFLKNKKILIGITGSIAAFKACDIIRFLKDCGCQVKVVLTQGAENFVTPTTLETLSGSPVGTGFWNTSSEGSHPSSGFAHGTHHIDTARWADLILIAPATAHFIGKMACGLADDLLSTELLAFQGPIWIAPAMNPAMFGHPAVQQNLKTLTERGVQLLGPASGKTSCGEEGWGRLLDPALILEKITTAFYPTPPADETRSLVITLGPTQSKIDPIRYLTNRSSGWMGASLCWAARQAGYQVTAICGPTEVPLPSDIQVIRVQTTQEMAQATRAAWTETHLRSKTAIFIGAAAVLDWNIKNPSPIKLKKNQGPLHLEFETNPDILAEISKSKKPGQFILGFAAETDHPLENGREKLNAKACDALFINDVSSNSQGIESDSNGGWWITPGQPAPDPISPDVTSGPIFLETCLKIDLAKKLLTLIEQRV